LPMPSWTRNQRWILPTCMSIRVDLLQRPMRMPTRIQKDRVFHRMREDPSSAMHWNSATGRTRKLHLYWWTIEDQLLSRMPTSCLPIARPDPKCTRTMRLPTRIHSNQLWMPIQPSCPTLPIRTIDKKFSNRSMRMPSRIQPSRLWRWLPRVRPSKLQSTLGDQNCKWRMPSLPGIRETCC